MAVRKVVIAVDKVAREGRSYEEFLRQVRQVGLNGATVEGMSVYSDVTAYAGQVLATWSETVRVMSDVWESVPNYRVWLGEAPAVTGERGALRYSANGTEYLPGLEEPTRDYSSATSYETLTQWTVDATPEVMAKYAEWVVIDNERLSEERAAREEAYRLAEIEKEKVTVRRGKVARVVRGRKVPKGTQGVVVWIGSGTYGDRVGIATSEAKDRDGRYKDVQWTALSNVEVVLDDEVVAPVVEVEPAPVVEAPVVTQDVASLLAALSAQVAALTAEVADLKKPKRKARKAVTA